MIMHALEYVVLARRRLHILLWCAQCERRRLREMQLTSQLAERNLSVAYRGVRQADLARATTMLTESMQQNEQILICSVVTGVVDEGYRDRGGFWWRLCPRRRI